MAKRVRSTGSDVIDRLKVVGSVAFFAVCGLVLTALVFLGPHGWLFSVAGAVLLVALFLFWPYLRSLFGSVFQPKPKRAKRDE